MRFRADRPLGLAPATVLDYRELARRRLPRQLFDYLDGGAYEEPRCAPMCADLERVLLRQVVMRDVSTRDQRVEVLGQQLAFPVILAPVGLGGMFARRAEVQAARAAESAGVPFVESTVSICSIEEVARRHVDAAVVSALRDARPRLRGGPDGARRAVASPVLVLTVDLAVVGARHRDTRNAVIGEASPRAKLLRGLDLALHPRGSVRSRSRAGRSTFGNLADAVPGARTPAAFREWVDAQFDPSVTWEDIAWVRERWDGRLVVKGVLDPEDARRAVDAGVDGHRGFQPWRTSARLGALDGAGAARDRRRGRRPAEVLADGGVRTGLDVVKMIALGARAVLIGRPGPGRWRRGARPGCATCWT